MKYMTGIIRKTDRIIFGLMLNINCSLNWISIKIESLSQLNILAITSILGKGWKLWIKNKETWGLKWVYSQLQGTVLLKVGSKFERSSRVWYIFLKAFFCPKKQTQIWKCLIVKKSPLSIISFERIILEKMAEIRFPLF